MKIIKANIDFKLKATLMLKFNLKPMKKLFTLFLFEILFFATGISQNVGIGTNSPDASALLEIKSSNKGLLIPQVNLLSFTDLTTIPGPATGLIIYNLNTSLGAGFYYNANTSASPKWIQLASSVSAWSTLGNSGTDSTLNFIGTTDSKPLILKVNNQLAGRIGVNGTIALGRAAIGKNMAYNLSSTKTLIAIGDSALYNQEANNTASNYEITAIGTRTLYKNTTGQYLTAIGANSLYGNTTGYANTAVGDYSLYSNQTGSGNIAVGSSALATNTTGNKNTAVGTASLLSSVKANNNTAIGNSALYSDTSGNENTAVGVNALLSNLSGYGNIAIGNYSLSKNYTGNYNTAVGLFALYYDSTGGSNTGIGLDALYSNIGGSYNTALGADALFNNKNAFSNTAVGTAALYKNTTGNYNTAFGNGALFTDSISSNNTAIGAFSDIAADGLTNATALGFNAIVDASNKVRIGNDNVTVIGGKVNWSTFSDGRYKKDIQNDIKGLEFILKLNPVSYYYNFQKLNAERMANAALKLATDNTIKSSTEKAISIYSSKTYIDELKKSESIRYSGFIAQEVEAAAKSIGYDFSGIDKPESATGTYALKYAEFVVPLVKAVQEQESKIQELKKENDSLKNTIDNLIKRLDKLEKK
jgi:hypothetical protein